MFAVSAQTKSRWLPKIHISSRNVWIFCAHAISSYPVARNSSNQICVPILINVPENLCHTNEKTFKISRIWRKKSPKNSFRFFANISRTVRDREKSRPLRGQKGTTYPQATVSERKNQFRENLLIWSKLWGKNVLQLVDFRVLSFSSSAHI